MTIWSEAPQEVIRIADELIALHHSRLRDANIGFLFRDDLLKRQRKSIVARTQILPEYLKTWLNYDFLIWICEETWDELTPAGRRALIDHELCHCLMIDGVPSLRGHDVEEFHEILERHGLWNPSLVDAETCIQRAIQLELPNVMTLIRGHGEVAGIDPALVPVSLDSLNQN